MDFSDIKDLVVFAKDMNNGSVKHRLFDTSPDGYLYSTKINGMYVLLPVGDNFDKIRDACRNVFNEQAASENKQ
jgi:hypothetical protein